MKLSHSHIKILNAIIACGLTMQQALNVSAKYIVQGPSNSQIIKIHIIPAPLLHSKNNQILKLHRKHVVLLNTL